MNVDVDVNFTFSSDGETMSGRLTEAEWEVLIRAIKLGRCTPFLGAGASAAVLPTGAKIANAWATKYNYPLTDSSNLISVSQFLAVNRDAMFPKYEMVEMFGKQPAPNFKDPLDPHVVLATLPLPFYLTTNYDDFMAQALKQKMLWRQPQRVLCQWNRAVKNLVRDNPDLIELKQNSIVNVANPVIFHLHGYVPFAESLVLTEDDYLDFLVNIAGDKEIIPPQIEKALTGNTLLFLGYRIGDWNFRVILRSFARLLESSVLSLNIAVMKLPEPSASTTAGEVQAYLTKYYQNIGVRVYWGEMRDFMTELKTRWDLAQE
jgi:hypothetical protein